MHIRFLFENVYRLPLSSKSATMRHREQSVGSSAHDVDGYVHLDTMCAMSRKMRTVQAPFDHRLRVLKKVFKKLLPQPYVK
jgi:hypothetical protein